MNGRQSQLRLSAVPRPATQSLGESVPLRQLRDHRSRNGSNHFTDECLTRGGGFMIQHAVERHRSNSQKLTHRRKDTGRNQLARGSDNLTFLRRPTKRCALASSNAARLGVFGRRCAADRLDDSMHNSTNANEEQYSTSAYGRLQHQDRTLRTSAAWRATRCYACYGEQRYAKHEKSQDGVADVTDVTDVTANERGCTCHACTRASAAARYVHTPLSRGVTSVTSVTCPEPYSGFCARPRRNIAVHVTAAPARGVTA